jgi:hypothetical protein
MENISNNNEATAINAVVEEAVEKTDTIAVATIEDNNVATINENEATNVETDATTLVQPCDSDEACNEDCGYQLGGIITAVILVIFVLCLVIKSKKRPASKGKKKSFKTNPNAVEIYVGNLSYEIGNSELRREFEKFGIVTSARIITHRNSRKSKGYGFVEMPHRSEAEEAIRALNNKDIKGRKIHVNEARANTRHDSH